MYKGGSSTEEGDIKQYLQEVLKEVYDTIPFECISHLIIAITTQGHGDRTTVSSQKRVVSYLSGCASALRTWRPFESAGLVRRTYTYHIGRKRGMCGMV